MTRAFWLAVAVVGFSGLVFSGLVAREARAEGGMPPAAAKAVAPAGSLPAPIIRVLPPRAVDPAPSSSASAVPAPVVPTPEATYPAATPALARAPRPCTPAPAHSCAPVTTCAPCSPCAKPFDLLTSRPSSGFRLPVLSKRPPMRPGECST